MAATDSPEFATTMTAGARVTCGALDSHSPDSRPALAYLEGAAVMEMNGWKVNPLGTFTHYLHLAYSVYFPKLTIVLRRLP